MQYNKTVSNPMLIGALELLKAEETPEHRKMVSDQIVKGTFICPAMLNPIPQPGPDGRVVPSPNTQIQFPMVNASDGKKFFMAFTDEEEYHKWKDYEGKQFFAATFDDYVMLMFNKNEKGQTNESHGFIVNPFGAKIIVPKEMVAQYMIAKASQAKKDKK